jgi:hypothetical protein
MTGVVAQIPVCVRDLLIYAPVVFPLRSENTPDVLSPAIASQLLRPLSVSDTLLSKQCGILCHTYNAMISDSFPIPLTSLLSLPQIDELNSLADG